MIDTQTETFFVTTVGTPIRKVFDLLNRELVKRRMKLPNGQPLKVSGVLLRKAIETATSEHSAVVAADVAGHLQHSAETARRHYVSLTVVADALRVEAEVTRT